LIVSKLWTALRRRTHRRRQLYGHGRRATDATHGPSADTDTDTDTDADPQTEARFGSVDTVRSDSSEGTDTDTAADSARPAWGSTVDVAADTGEQELPLVNLFIEEASKVAASGVVTDLLKQARSFGCGVTLSMQYPAQLKHADPETYNEVLNNVSTIITGNVPLDRDLAARLATSDMEPQEVANRLRALSRGEWLCALPAGFGEVEPRPFVLDSTPLPPGHPDGSYPLSEALALQCDIEQLRREARTRREHGLTIATPATVDAGTDRTGGHGRASRPGMGARGGRDEGDEDDAQTLSRVDTALPYTRRLPETVMYDEARHALECRECGNRYDPSSQGMRRAIDCCSSLAAVDPDDIPITAVNLKLTPEERAETGLSDRELVLLQVIHNAQQRRYDPPEYDLLDDSMIRLLEYVGASTDAVQTLIDAGYLTHDTNHPHRLYSVTPEGRTVIGEAYRSGVDFGHGKGDLEETSLHVMMVEVGYRYLVQEYENNPDSPVEAVIKYFDLEQAPIDTTLDRAADDGDEDGVSDEASPAPVEDAAEGSDADAVSQETASDVDMDATARPDERGESEVDARRIDAAGLDAEGNVVVMLEAERVNHDVRRAAPADYDKMAACDPEEAIWICSTQKAGYKILRALNEPLDGTPRVEKEYSSTTPPHQYRIDTPGLTAMYNVEYVRDRLTDDTA
jgi:hypothetical protein